VACGKGHLAATAEQAPASVAVQCSDDDDDENNNLISIAPYGRNFRDAGGR